MRSNGHLEKEIFYQNLRSMRERSRIDKNNDLEYYLLENARYTVLDEYHARFVANPQKRDYLKILRE